MKKKNDCKYRWWEDVFPFFILRKIIKKKMKNNCKYRWWEAAKGGLAAVNGLSRLINSPTCHDHHHHDYLHHIL